MDHGERSYICSAYWYILTTSKCLVHISALLCSTQAKYVRDDATRKPPPNQCSRHPPKQPHIKPRLLQTLQDILPCRMRILLPRHSFQHTLRTPPSHPLLNRTNIQNPIMQILNHSAPRLLDQKHFIRMHRITSQ